MPKRGIPDRWIPYTALGKVVEGTKFISFKVPLKLSMQEDIESKWDTAALLSSVPNIGLVVDLTNTDRYYNPEDLKSRGVQYNKINCPGRIVPPENTVQKFIAIIDTFLESESDKLIGVHCTHGLNRTGYFICRYMRDKMGFDAATAIKLFETARGYHIERQNFIADLKGLPPLASDKGPLTRIVPVSGSRNEKLNLNWRSRSPSNHAPIYRNGRLITQASYGTRKSGEEKNRRTGSRDPENWRTGSIDPSGSNDRGHGCHRIQGTTFSGFRKKNDDSERNREIRKKQERERRYQEIDMWYDY